MNVIAVFGATGATRRPDSAPARALARDGAPRDGAPRDGAPRDGAPHDGAPHDGAPHDGAPLDGAQPIAADLDDADYALSTVPKRAHYLLLLAATALALSAAAAAVAIEPGDTTGAVPMQPRVQTAAAVAPLPQRLAETGLYASGSSTEVSATNLPFSPQYPLWSDGTTKRRWLYLPSGTSIDASRPDAWEFPRGTRLWKEFSFGRRVETRFIERQPDGSWRYATYVWNEDGSEAVLAPSAGMRSLPVATAPNGRYAVPSQRDCLACHEGGAVPVLGVSALQLSPDRDPLAPHAEGASSANTANAVSAANAANAATDLRTLLARGWLKGLPRELLDTPPRIAAASPVERAALGYLHGNCGHCHNDVADAAVPVGIRLAHRVGSADASLQVADSLLGATSRFQVAGAADMRVVTPGHAGRSVLAQRMRSRDTRTQMPPLGTQVPDVDGIALIERWINHELQARTQPTQEPKS